MQLRSPTVNKGIIIPLLKIAYIWRRGRRQLDHTKIHLEALQQRQDIIPANRVFLDAFLTDVRPILQMARLEKDLPLDPLAAYDETRYQQKIEQERH